MRRGNPPRRGATSKQLQSPDRPARDMAAGARRPQAWAVAALLVCLAACAGGGASAQIIGVDVTNNTLVLTSGGFAASLADSNVDRILISCEATDSLFACQRSSQSACILLLREGIIASAALPTVLCTTCKCHHASWWCTECLTTCSLLPCSQGEAEGAGLPPNAGAQP